MRKLVIFVFPAAAIYVCIALVFQFNAPIARDWDEDYIYTRCEWLNIEPLFHDVQLDITIYMARSRHDPKTILDVGTRDIFTALTCLPIVGCFIPPYVANECKR